MQELIYTSVEQGLNQATGFCTVAATPNMSPHLADLLAKLSSYKHLHPPTGAPHPGNPTNYSFVTSDIGGVRYHILSVVSDAGLDYSNRTNKLGRHLVFQEGELPNSGPARLLGQAGTFTEWTGEVGPLPQRRISGPDAEPGICKTWREVTGDAGWGGWLAETVLKNQPAAVIITPQTPALALVQEALALLPCDKHWQTTFSTFYAGGQAKIECNWRFCLAGTINAQRAKALPNCLDLSKVPELQDSIAVEAARTGSLIQIKTEESVSNVTSSDFAEVGESPGEEVFDSLDVVPDSGSSGRAELYSTLDKSDSVSPPTQTGDSSWGKSNRRDPTVARSYGGEPRRFGDQAMLPPQLVPVGRWRRLKKKDAVYLTAILLLLTGNLIQYWKTGPAQEVAEKRAQVSISENEGNELGTGEKGGGAPRPSDSVQRPDGGETPTSSPTDQSPPPSPPMQPPTKEVPLPGDPDQAAETDAPNNNAPIGLNRLSFWVLINGEKVVQIQEDSEVIGDPRVDKFFRTKLGRGRTGLVLELNDNDKEKIKWENNTRWVADVAKGEIYFLTDGRNVEIDLKKLSRLGAFENDRLSEFSLSFSVKADRLEELSQDVSKYKDALKSLYAKDKKELESISSLELVPRDYSYSNTLKPRSWAVEID